MLIQFPHQPPTGSYNRIVSLVPSITEFLCAIGLEEYLVGITKFCVHPNHLRQSKTIVGGTKNVDTKKVASLAPNLILAAKEENEQAQMLVLAQDHLVCVADVQSIQDFIAYLQNFIHLFPNSTRQISELGSSISTRLSRPVPKRKISCLYLIWKNPYMAAGGDTFIHSMLAQSGFCNVLQGQKRYPTLPIKEVVAFNPEVILLSSEPYPFKDRDVAAIQNLTGIPAKWVDGEMFSWYGSRIINGLDYGIDVYNSLIPILPLADHEGV